MRGGALVFVCAAIFAYDSAIAAKTGGGTFGSGTRFFTAGIERK
jgi:hypothetical protein